jgi:hypothetical protein
MVSSHGLYYPTYDPTPYQYANQQFVKRQSKIIGFLQEHGGSASLEEFNSTDIIYHRAKITGAYRKLVDWWEMWMIRHHLEDMCENGLAFQESQDSYSLQ